MGRRGANILLNLLIFYGWDWMTPMAGVRRPLIKTNNKYRNGTHHPMTHASESKIVNQEFHDNTETCNPMTKLL